MCPTKLSKRLGSRNQTTNNHDFTTYKDFTSDKSLDSADFEASFEGVKASFYSSSSEESPEENLFRIQPTESPISPRKSKTKEEETNYTTKPGLIMEKEEIKKTFWCTPCMLKSSEVSKCLII
jgi:hypothetical protein